MQPSLAEQVHTRIDQLFDRDQSVYGRDLAPYRGHVHRVAGLVAGQVDLRAEWVEAVAVASYYHDAAIWFDHTWDYLPGSKSRAAQELSESSHGTDIALVDAMIDEHHRLRHARHRHPLVEAMRRADAADVYRVGIPEPITRAQYGDLLARFPDAGLHRMLARGFVMGLRERKRLNPMPMLKL